MRPPEWQIQLQVVADNPDGLRFFESLGWHPEIIQVVWDS
jgi:hypothetical protein